MSARFFSVSLFLVANAISIAGPAFGSFVVSPTSGSLGSTRWEVTNNNSALSPADVTGIVNVQNLVLRYKYDGASSGTHSSSYTTTFSNSANDPKDFDITWSTQNPLSYINDTRVFLVVKNGNHNPNQYIFEISRTGGILNPGWDGKSTIQGRGFWLNGGAISHIAIFGNQIPRPSDGPFVPEPATIALFATGLVCLAFRRQRYETAPK